MKTDELQLFYPDFVPNQILTNTQLNQLRTFLDEQSRLTRIRLIGRGIACGLAWRIEDLGGTARRVVIYEGYGISSDGFLVELYVGEGEAPPSQHVAFTGVRPYTDAYVDEEGAPLYEHWQELADPTQQIDLQELVTDSIMGTEDAPDDAEPLTQSDLDGKVIVLYVEADEQELKSCLVTDCDNKGLNVHLRARALLVEEAALETWDPCGERLTTRVDVPRLHASLRDAPSGPDALAEVDAADEINAGYGRIVKAVRDAVTGVLNDGFDAYGTFLGLDEDEKDDAVDALESLLADSVDDGDFSQYHFDFVKDVAAACNEFVRAACDLVADCCPEYDFPRHLMLGAVDGTEGYRHTFVASPVRNVAHTDLARVEGLFRRILVLVDAFDPGAFAAADDIRVTPSQTEWHPLGTRAVPYYYGFADEVQDAWLPRGCCSTDLLWSYFAATGGDGAPIRPFDTAYAEVSLFRIEGHLHADRDGALTALEARKTEDNLEFDVIPLQLIDAAAEADDAVEEMLEALAEIQSQQLQFRIRHIMQIVEPDASWYEEADPVEAFREAVREARDDLYRRNLEWMEARETATRLCSVDALQADYLLLRNELLADYKRIHLYLTALLDYLRRLPDILLEDLPEYLEARENLRETTDFEARAEDLRAQEEDLQRRIDETEDPAERQLLEQELSEVSEERDAYERAAETVDSMADFLRTLSTVLSREGEFEATPLIAVVVGLIIEVANLRDHVHEMIHYLLPADLRRFNYRLFDGKHSALRKACLELQLFPVFIALYAAALVDRDDLPTPDVEDGPQIDLPGDVWGDIFENVVLDQETADYLVRALQALGGLWHLVKLFNGMHHNRMQVRFATVYHALLQLEKGHVFGEFAGRHPGMEHLAGVEKGGTFLLVCDEEEVVADFALRGRVPCCCELDPDEICLPPVAVPDFHIVVRPFEGEGATAEIDVLRNDYDLLDASEAESYENDHPRPYRIELASEASEQGAAIEVVETEEGARIRYTNDDGDFYGIDGFRYTLFDERAEETCTGTGHVVVLVVPAFISEPEEEAGVLEGTVTVLEEQPISGIDLTLSGEAGTFTATSGDAGAYRFSDIPPASYTLSVNETDFEPFSAEVAVESDGTTRFDVSLQPAEVETGRLTGVVASVDGTPLPGAAVALGGIQIAAGQAGRFVFDNVQPGTYTLLASAAGHRTFVEEGIDIAAGQTVEVNITLQRLIITVVGNDSPGVLTVSEVENLSVDEAEERVGNTLGERLNARMETLRTSIDDPDLASSPELQATEEFISAAVSDEELTGERLNEAYDRMAERLKRSIEAAPEEEKAAYRTMLEVATAEYLDRYTLEQPVEVTAEAEERFTTVFTGMRDAGVDLNTFSEGFKAEELNTNASNDAANHIASLMLRM